MEVAGAGAAAAAAAEAASSPSGRSRLRKLYGCLCDEASSPSSEDDLIDDIIESDDIPVVPDELVDELLPIPPPLRAFDIELEQNKKIESQLMIFPASKSSSRY